MPKGLGQIIFHFPCLFYWLKSCSVSINQMGMEKDHLITLDAANSGSVFRLLSSIRRQLEINVEIAEKNNPEGPIIDGKRVKGVVHSQDILAQHIRDHLDELEELLKSTPSDDQGSSENGGSTDPLVGISAMQRKFLLNKAHQMVALYEQDEKDGTAWDADWYRAERAAWVDLVSRLSEEPQTVAEPSMDASRIADALELCDWSGCSIGNKEILKAAVAALRSAPVANAKESRQ